MGLYSRIKSFFTSKKLSSRTNALRGFLGGSAIGVWASDHFAESQEVLEWSYVAIKKKAQQAYQAEMTLTRVVQPNSRRHPLHKEWKAEGKNRLLKLSGIVCEAKGEVGGIEGPRESVTRIAADRQELAHNHPLARLLRRPNPFQSRGSLLFAISQQIETTGTALLWVVPGPDGVPAEMYVIPTGVAIPQRRTDEYPDGWYRVNPIAAYALVPGGGDGQGFGTGTLGNLMAFGGPVDARQVHPIRWPHPIYLSDGLSPLAAGAITIDTLKQLVVARNANFQNSIRPGIIFKGADQLDDDEKEAFRLEMRAKSAGPQHTGRDLYIPNGIETDQMEAKEHDLDYRDGYTQLRDATLAFQDVTPLVAGVAEGGSYAALFAGLLQWVTLSVQPMLDLIGDELVHFLNPLFAETGETLEISLKAKSIQDPDLALKQKAATQNDTKLALAAKVIRFDELRVRCGLEPIGGPEGQEFVGAELKTSSGSGDAEEQGHLSTGVSDPLRESMPKRLAHLLNGNGHAK